jgi:hypothetical protein
LRAADIELIYHRFGGEQWSEHFAFSKLGFNIAYPACERRFAVCYALVVLRPKIRN